MNRYEDLVSQIAMVVPDRNTGKGIRQFINLGDEGSPPTPLHEERLKEIEAHFGHSLPEGYCEFLRCYGGLIVPNGLRLRTPTAEGFPVGLLGVFYDDEMLLSHNTIPRHLPWGLIEIANGDNGFWCLSINGEHTGEIYFWDSRAGKEIENFHFIASSFDNFLQRLATPLDEDNPLGF